jgi:hypothetical protein
LFTYDDDDEVFLAGRTTGVEMGVGDITWKLCDILYRAIERD